GRTEKGHAWRGPFSFRRSACCMLRRPGEPATIDDGPSLLQSHRISKQNRSARAPVNKPVNVRPCPRFGTKRSPAGSPWGPRRSHGGCNVREETRERARSSGRPATPAHERDPCAAIVAQSGARPASGTRPRTQSRDWWHHAGPARPGAAQGQEDRATLVATLGFPARKPALDADAAI